jgi:hypothetical protein
MQADSDHKVHVAHKDLQEMTVHKDPLVQLVLFLAHLVHKDHPVYKVHKVHKDQLVHKVSLEIDIKLHLLLR